MIQTTLFFVLGFLSASFLALMAAPIVWRRAVVLTRRRIEASVPLTMDEIQADKDRMRAEFAMSTRRLEMSAEELRQKVANQLIAINRNREELKRIAAERDERNDAVLELQATVAEMRAELKKREDALADSAEKLSEAEQRLEESARELEHLNLLYDEVSINASSRQIELVAQETKVEQLSEDLAVLRNERKAADQRVRELAAEVKELQQALREERKKLATSERKMDGMVASLAEQEEKLERRDRELTRLRDQIKDVDSVERSLSEDVESERAERMRLETEVTALTDQLSRLISGATSGDLSASVSKLQADRKRMEERLISLTRENKRLRDEIETLHDRQEPAGERSESAQLREQIRDLAAEVIALTAALEGPQSPIHAALQSGAASNDGSSLADRVRALQTAAAGSR